MDVSIRDLKSGLSRYLKQVQQGETIQVTSRGKPVAHLVPIRSGMPVSERLASLPGVDAGSGGKPRGATRLVRNRPGEKRLSDLVLETRR